MKTITFVAITLISGAIAGTILGIINQGLVEPYIERAIALENQNARDKGELLDLTLFNNYRMWQKGGEIFAGTIYGISISSLFGVVFAYARSSLPGSKNGNNVKKALILAGIMWFVLFIVPATKYPANPPAVGSPDTLAIRQSLYMSFMAISGFSALALAFAYRKLWNVKSKKVIIPLTYAGIMIAAYVFMPPNPDPINAPMDLVIGFRLVSAFTVSIFWGTMAGIFGLFWNKFKPHETAKIAI